MEVWQKIRGFSNYEVSRYGKVRNRITEKILKFSVNKGYLRVTLYGNKRKTFYVQRLVIETFKGRSKLQVYHKDLDKTNNRLSNLEYVTQSENQRHSYKNNPNHRESCKRAWDSKCLSKRDQARIIKLSSSGLSLKKISNLMGKHKSTIHRVVNGRYRKSLTV